MQTIRRLNHDPFQYKEKLMERERRWEDGEEEPAPPPPPPAVRPSEAEDADDGAATAIIQV